MGRLAAQRQQRRASIPSHLEQVEEPFKVGRPDPDATGLDPAHL